MRRIFRLTLLLGLVGGAVAAFRRMLGPKEAPAPEAQGAAGGETGTPTSPEQPASAAATAEPVAEETEPTAESEEASA